MDGGEKISTYIYAHGHESFIIDNDVWISAYAVVLHGVEIGNGAFIDAGVVVTKVVEPYSIVAVAPTKNIKKRFNEATITKLNEIRVCNWHK